MHIGPDIRAGAPRTGTAKAKRSGIVMMRYGADALKTIEGVKERIGDRERSPPGVKLRAAYDRSDLIHRAIGTLREKLIEEALVVAAIACCSSSTCAPRWWRSSPSRSQS